MTQTLYTQSLVGIIPDSLRDKANMIALAMGFGQGNYSVPLAQTEDGPATHWGFRAAATKTTVEVLAGASPDDEPHWAAFGITPDDLEAVKSALVIDSVDRKRSNAYQHFHKVLDGEGLHVVISE